MERKTRQINTEVDKAYNKKEENYKIKWESLNQAMILKPFYKKFCIIRNISMNNSEEINIRISKTRDNIILKPSTTDQINIPFDNILSLVNNPYEELKYINETTYLNEEIISTLMSYMIKINTSSEEKDFLALYITDNVIDNQCDGNRNIYMIFQELLNRLSHYSEHEFYIKIILKDSFKDIIKEIRINYNHKTILNIQEIEDKIKTYSNIIGIYFGIRNMKNNSKMKIFYFNIDSMNIINNLLTKFSEINVSKKKRLASSKRKKTIKDIHFILDEMEFVSSFFFAAFLDINVKELASENIKEILFNL